VHTFKRDDVNVHELRDAVAALASSSAGSTTTTSGAHSPLGMRSPGEYRRASTHVPIGLGNWGAGHDAIESHKRIRCRLHSLHSGAGGLNDSFGARAM